MKSQYHHSFPTQIQSSSFNFPSYLHSPAFIPKQTPIQLSSKIEYWAIKSNNNKNKNRRKREIALTLTVTGAASIGLLVILMGQDKAWALGPEGPLVEEFWENVRRYALYALTVSTGVLYAVLQPIFELLKNPFLLSLSLLSLQELFSYFLKFFLLCLVSPNSLINMLTRYLIS
ncbi:Uncharacterized protein RDABS01_037652 [Bienertia sinuspersici]